MYHASEVRDYHAFAYLTDTTNGVKNKSLGLFGVDEAEAIKAKYEQLDGVIVTLNVAPTYKCKKADIEAARACAVWPDATLEQLRDKEALEARLPALMAEFRKDIESLGFTF
jgi:hypothetical protein